MTSHAAASTTRATQPLLEVSGLTKHFPVSGKGIFGRSDSVVRAVDGVDLAIRSGETLGLVGETGSGKSTLGRTILQLYRPTGGSIVFEGTDLAQLSGRRLRRARRDLQMIFQDPYASLNPRLTIGRIISEPLEVHRVAGRRDRAERVVELLRTVGLNPAFANRYPHEFSGGQRQRVGIARALALDPKLIVADEPVSALDVSIQAQIINLLDDLQDRLNLTYLFIAHDLAVVRHISDRVAVMYLGKVIESAASEELYQRPLHPYTIALMSAVPIADPDVEARRKRIVLTGDIPSPVDPPSGCRFHPRCWLRRRLGNPENCVAEAPAFRELGPGHGVACHWAEHEAVRA